MRRLLIGLEVVAILLMMVATLVRAIALLRLADMDLAVKAVVAFASLMVLLVLGRTLVLVCSELREVSVV